jgi:hypothetical protein
VLGEKLATTANKEERLLSALYHDEMVEEEYLSQAEVPH